MGLCSPVTKLSWRAGGAEDTGSLDEGDSCFQSHLCVGMGINTPSWDLAMVLGAVFPTRPRW